MKRKASVIWTGELKTGAGKVSTESGALKEAPYSFTTRFEEEPGTNPEELIAAAPKDDLDNIRRRQCDREAALSKRQLTKV